MGKFTVRAAVYSPSKGDYLKKLGADEIVKFDLTDKGTWDGALKGVEAVYSASLDPLLEHHLSFSKHLGTLQGQVKHVVRVSCMGADTNTDTIDNEGWFSNPLGKTRNSFVCTNDIAEVAVQCLLEGPKLHSNKFYDLTGPAPQNMDEIAADLSVALGKKIEYRPQNLADFEKDFGPTRAAFFEYLANGFYTRCSPDFYNIIGRKPTSYADYLANKGAAGETGLEELYQSNMWKKGEDAMKAAVAAVSKH